MGPQQVIYLDFNGKYMLFGVSKTQIQTPILPFTGCVAMRSLFNFSELSCLQLYNWDRNSHTDI